MTNLNRWVQSRFEQMLCELPQGQHLDFLSQYIDTEVNHVMYTPLRKFVNQVLSEYVECDEFKKILINTLDWTALEKCIMYCYQIALEDLSGLR